MEEKPNYTIMIPSEVRYDARLTPMAKLLYGEIEQLTHQDGTCWASNDYFANLYSIRKETVSRRISELAELEYITIELLYKQGTKEVDKRIIKLSTPIDEKVNTYRQKSQEGIDEKVIHPIDLKVKENNINTINTSINNRVESAQLPDSVDKYYIDNIGPMSNQVVKELGAWLTKVHDSLIKYAIDEAVKYDKKTWAYVRAVIRGNYEAGRLYGTEELEKDKPKQRIAINAEDIKRISELGA